MKKILIITIIIYVLIAMVIFNLPMIYNHRISYLNGCDSIAISIKNDSIRNRILKNSENREDIIRHNPCVALSFNNNLHINKIEFLDNNREIVASLDSSLIPYDNMDLSKTNYDVLKNTINSFPLPTEYTSEKTIELSLSMYAHSLIDSLDGEGSLTEKIIDKKDVQYTDILNSIYSEYLYIIDDTITTIRLNDVGTIYSVNFANNISVRQPFFHIFTKENNTDPILKDVIKILGKDKVEQDLRNKDDYFNYSIRLVCHSALKENELVMKKLANKTVYVSYFSKNYIFQDHNYIEREKRERWIPSKTINTFLIVFSILFLLSAIILLLLLTSYLIRFNYGNNQYYKKPYSNYLYYYSCYNLFDKGIILGNHYQSYSDYIARSVVWISHNLVKGTFVNVFMFPFAALYLLVGIGLAIIEFVDKNWLQFIKALLIAAIGLSVYFLLDKPFITIILTLLFVLLLSIVLHFSIIIVDYAIKRRHNYIEKKYYNASKCLYIHTGFSFVLNKNEVEDDLLLFMITKKTLSSIEKDFLQLSFEIKKIMKEYPEMSASYLKENGLSGNELLSNIYYNSSVAHLISDIPNELKRRDLAREVDLELTSEYPYGYLIWKFINGTQVTYDTINHAKKWSPICEERILTFDLNTYAQFYLRQGFTITTIKGEDDNKRSWKNSEKNITSASYLSDSSFDNCTGIGIMLGENSNIRALDFDNLNYSISTEIENILNNGDEPQDYLKNFLHEVLNILGLPENYPWVVISGSHRGIHILFNCDELSETLSISSCSFQEPDYYSSNNSPSLFERVELRWKCHLVLPPSLHQTRNQINGERQRYVFSNGILPFQSPLYVSIKNINDYLLKKCSSITIADGYYCSTTNLPLALVYTCLNYSHTSSGKPTSKTTIEKREYVEWLIKCNDSNSLNTLGVFYCLGWNVESDLNQARMYFERADNDLSRFNLAMLISCGCLDGTLNEIEYLLNGIDFGDINNQLLQEYKHIIETNINKLYNPNDSFSDEQLSVIEITEGKHLVLAPPGCGKTRVLAERVVYAMNNNVNIDDMLCLTFTNRAAREMKDRISKRVGSDILDNLFVGNIHHFCSCLLRKHGIISQRCTIIDDEESTNILKEIIHQLFGKDLENVESFYNFQHYCYQIEHSHPEDLIIKPDFGKMQNRIEYKTVAKAFESYKKKYDLIDFDDLLLLGYDIIRNNQDVIKKYSWIQVDEVQDLNMLQIAIINLVAKNFEGCVVYLGDEQQAIYGYNGAKLSTLEKIKNICINNIHHFYGNYRSPQYLLDVLNKYAVCNLNVSEALLPTARGKNSRDRKQSDYLIIETCDKKLGFHSYDYCSYDMACDRAVTYLEGRTAILTNSNKEVDIICEKLNNRGIEHFKISGSDFMWSNEIKLILSHFNVFIHPESTMSWARILIGLNIMTSLESAHSFISNAYDAYLNIDDLLKDKSNSLIKDFIKYYAEELIIFDTETTGLDVNNDDIVEISAIKLCKGNVIDEFDIILETRKEIPEKLGELPNPLIEEYNNRNKINRNVGLSKFLSWVGGTPILAHNVQYDFQILDANLKKYCGIYDLSLRWTRVLDSLAITKLVEPDLKSYKLKDLLEELELQGNNTHLAIDDVYATKNLVDYCYQKTYPILINQNVFFDTNQLIIGILRNRYSELYRHTEEYLSMKGQNGQNAFIMELEYVYNHFIESKYISRLEKMKYLEIFLAKDFLFNTSDLTLYQILDKYLLDLVTLREADLCDSKSLKEKVNLYVSTVHRSKGLEFDNVIVSGVVDGNYPFWKTNEILEQSKDPIELSNAQQDIEESKRKLYVALSRAKKRLCIQYPRNNTGFGQYGWYSHPAKLSPFIDCIINMFKMINSRK